MAQFKEPVTLVRILIITRVYMAFGHWTFALTLSFAAFGRSGREIYDVRRPKSFHRQFVTHSRMEGNVSFQMFEMADDFIVVGSSLLFSKVEVIVGFH